jgi:hypothetical protein
MFDIDGTPRPNPPSIGAYEQLPKLSILTTLSFTGTLGTNWWYKSDGDVAFSVADTYGLMDVTGTYYSIDGSAVQSYTSLFTITSDGIHNINYWSTGLLGNVENQSSTVQIDTTPPTTTQKLAGYKMDGFWVGGVTATLYPADATSGIASTYYAPSSTNIIPYTGPFFYGGAKVHTWSYWSVDNAGNKQKPVKVTATVVQPDINSLSQTSAKVGSHSFTLTVNGSYFINGAKVTWNGIAISTAYVSQNQLTATVPGHDLTTVGTFNIQVENPNSYGKTNKIPFTVN